MQSVQELREQSSFAQNVEPRRGLSEMDWPLRWSAVAAFVGALVAFVLAGWALGSAILSLEDGPVGRFDRSISHWFAGQRTGTWDLLTDVGSGLSDTLTVVAVIAVTALGLLLAWRRWREPLFLIMALLLEVTSFVSIAYLVGRERPPIEQLDPSPPTSGFPSGHTAAAVALYVGIAIIVHWNTLNRAARRMSLALAVLAPVAVALSRMYRGMHYLTDVAAGAILGAACLAMTLWILRRFSRSTARHALRTDTATPADSAIPARIEQEQTA